MVEGIKQVQMKKARNNNDFKSVRIIGIVMNGLI